MKRLPGCCGRDSNAMAIRGFSAGVRTTSQIERNGFHRMTGLALRRSGRA